MLDWASAESQRARFEVLINNVDLAGLALLDIGCGLGDLWAMLKQRRIDVRYTGVDILEKMIDAARARHRDGEFICADVFAADRSDQTVPGRFKADSFDVVFCSGAFNLDLGNNREFLPVAVARMLQLARRAAVFNLLHERAKFAEDGYFYCGPREVLAMIDPLRPQGWTLRILDDYLPNDFTVICSNTRPPG